MFHDSTTRKGPCNPVPIFVAEQLAGSLLSLQRQLRKQVVVYPDTITKFQQNNTSMSFCCTPLLTTFHSICGNLVAIARAGILLMPNPMKFVAHSPHKLAFSFQERTTGEWVS